MISFASSRVNGSISFFVRLGNCSDSAGFRLIKPSITADRRIVDSLTSALRFTPGELHSIRLTILRTMVVVMRSTRTSAKWTIQ
ncbi:hypothetical protein D3C77_317660 [compost metagenome]